ncbi:MAG: hypothetical protein H6605_11200 [Flavobacteriales bacterium]|nr:hypothetical protein [Flavobacteriales bacterium]
MNKGDENGNGNGNGNPGSSNGVANGNENTGDANGNGNGNANPGDGNGLANGNENSGDANGNGNGNANNANDNGNANGNKNSGGQNGNGNGNGNQDDENGVRNGNKNSGDFNGNNNGNANGSGQEFNGLNEAAEALGVQLLNDHSNGGKDISLGNLKSAVAESNAKKAEEPYKPAPEVPQDHYVPEAPKEETPYKPTEPTEPTYPTEPTPEPYPADQGVDLKDLGAYNTIVSIDDLEKAVEEQKKIDSQQPATGYVPATEEGTQSATQDTYVQPSINAIVGDEYDIPAPIVPENKPKTTYLTSEPEPEPYVPEPAEPEPYVPEPYVPEPKPEPESHYKPAPVVATGNGVENGN